MKKDYWVIMLAFLGGIVLANLLDGELLTTYGILNDYFLNQYSYRAVDGNRLFCQVVLLRGKAAFIIFLLGRVLSGRGFCTAMESLLGGTFGFLVVVSIVNLGIRGIAVCLVGLFPQWFFYLAALYFFISGMRDTGMMRVGDGRVKDVPTQLMRGALIILLCVIGILSESYVNPVLLGALVKFL